MLKTLYISDLDGTLLDSRASVSDTTVRVLNELISSGGYFSFATARTAVTALPLTEKININVPVVLMNGVCVYDTEKKEYVKTEHIPDKSFEEMSVDELKGFSDLFENDIFPSIDLINCVNGRAVCGGPSVEAVKKQLDEIKIFLCQAK